MLAAASAVTATCSSFSTPTVQRVFYAHNSRLIERGPASQQGQKIAELGDSDADQVKLHFEIRRQGKPSPILSLLPLR
ncbi:MAG: hypothetical protein M5R42_09405 [Rhodocyclaceae bacterium]|nr:hypothetical protein [Rhodocyclaceae bacterium]